jgi:putative DNA primase/helicase
MTETPSFPAELTARNQWCLWRLEPNKDGATKVPYRPDGRKAASNDPSTRTTAEAALDILHRQPASYAGLGYFFSEDDPACGIDLDACFDLSGDPQPWAGEVIAKFENTYRAYSQSGSGLHVLCHAVLPGKRNRRSFGASTSKRRSRRIR